MIEAELGLTPPAPATPAEPKETTFGGNVKEFFKGVVPGAIGLAESAAVGASALLPEDAEKATRQFVKETAASARKPFEAGAGYEESVGRKFGEAVGSTVPFLAAAPFGAPGLLAGAALGVGAGAGEARGRAEEGGAAAGDRSLATALGAGVGVAELFAPLRIMNRLAAPAKAGAVAAVKRALVAGGEEGAQEAATQIAQNLIAKGIYKPEQAIIEQVGESAAYGGATGALVQGLLDLAIGRRAPSAGAAGAVPDAEARAQAERERRETLKLEQGLGAEAKDAQAQGYVGQQGQLFRGLEKPTQPQRDLAGQILEPAPDEAAPRPSDLYEGFPLTTEVAQEAGFARTPEELEAAGQMQLGLDQAQDTEFFQQELATLDKEYTTLQAKKDKTPADNQRMREIRTRRTQLTEMVRERTANRGPQLKQGQDQGTLFQSLKKPSQPALGLTGQPLTPARDEAALRPSDVNEGRPVTTAAARKAGVALTPKELEAAGQTDFMLEATFEYADLVKMREQLKAMEQTPEIQRRIKYLDGQIRDYTLAGVDAAYQQRLEREASRPSPEQVAREAALAEQSAFAQQPEGQPVPEPTVRAKPTPETVPTLMSPDVLGTLGIGHSAILRKPTHPIHGLDIAKPEDAAEVKKMLTVYKEGKSAPIVQKVDAYLARPEFQGVPDVSATPAAQPAPAVSNQPRGRKRSVALPVQPATAELAGPGPGAAPATEESAAPVGRGLVPAGSDAGTGDARVSDAQPAVTLDQLQDRARALTEQSLAMLDKQGRVPREGTKKRAEYDVIVEQERAAKDAVAEADRAARKGKPKAAPGLPAPAPQTEAKKETKPKRGELTLAKARDTAGDLDLDPETTKAKVKAFATRLFKAGLIDEISMNAVLNIGKDRDMGPEDMIDEIEAALDFYEQEQGTSTTTPKQPQLTKEPVTIDVEAREIPDNQRALLEGPVSRLQDDQTAELEEFYGAPKDSPEFWARLNKDVATFAEKGAKAIAKAIREIVRQVHAGVLAVSMIFNPSGMTLPEGFVVTNKATITTQEQVLASVPAEVKGMSEGAKLAYQTMIPALKGKLGDKLITIADKPSGRIFIFKPDGTLVLQKKSLFGLAKGDLYKGNQDNPKNRITPAGMFDLKVIDAKMGPDEKRTAGDYDTGTVLAINDPDAWITIMHSVWLKEKDAGARAAALKTESAEDSRYSFGCINVDKATYKNLMDNYAAQMDGSKLFVVPDNQADTKDFLTGKKQGADVLVRESVEPATRTVTRDVDTTSAQKDTRTVAGREQKGLPQERFSVSSAAAGQALDAMQAEVANMPGLLGAALRRMIKSGKVKLEAASPDGRKVGGLYDGKTVTLYANGIPEGRVLSVALHEVGAHLGMKNLVGAKQYDAIIARLQNMIEKADGSPEAKMAQAAYKRIPIRDMKRGPEVFGDELLAYFVEEMAMSEAAGTLPKVGALRNLYNQIKTGILTAINRIFGTSLGINDLTAEQVQLIAKAAFTMESYTAAKGEASAEKSRNSIPGTAELDPASRAAIKALQDKLPVGERGPDGVVGQAMQGMKRARENSGIITTFRQAAADKFASVESKVSQMFSKGVRDSFGNLNPMVLVRQAEDNAKIIMDFFRAGGIRMNKEGLVETFDQDKSMVSALNKVKDFAAANGMTYEEAKAEISTVLEGHRVHGIRQYNNELEQSAIILAGKGKTKEAAEERARKITLHMTNAEIDTMESIYQKSKGIQSIQADLNATRTQAIDLMVSTGRISKEQGQFWKDNEAYVPFDRVFEDTAVAPKFTRGKGLAVLRNIPGMEGSLGRPVRNVLDAYANRLSWMVEDTMRNNASVKLLETMELGGFAREIDKPEAAQNKNLVVPRLYRDGKPVFFEVQNEYDMLAFQQAPEIMNGLTKALGATARILRISITAMPPFAIKQVVDDAQRAAFYSGVQRPLVVAMKTLYNFPKVFFGELTGRKSVAVKRMEELGIIGDYDFNIYEPVADIEKEIGAAKRNVAGKMFHRLEQLTKASDLAARLAVYEETMRETNGDELLAQTRARELINFTRRGSSATMRTAARVIPFFNAYAQGMDVLYRAASGIDGSSSGERSAARKMFMSRVAIMTAFGFAYALAMSDDEGYENATDEVRDNNWLLPGGYKIPVPKELAFIFKSIPERVVQYMKRLGTEEEQDITKALGSVVKAGFSAYGSPNAVPSFIRPVLENMTNYSFFLQRELESASMQRREAGQRFTSTTSELAKALGEATNMSPIKIDNFLRGTFGMAGSTTLLMTDAMLNPSRPDRPLYQMPFTSIFLYDTVGGRKKAEFYDLRERVGQADATYKDLLKTDPEKAQKFLESKESLIAAAPLINATLRDLSQMRALRTMVEQGSEEMLGMSGEERRELIDEIRGSENELVSYTRELEKMLRE
jgi:hypothetical protein